jgi:hypothetical protein
VTIQGLVFSNAADTAISLEGSGTNATITGCYIGTDVNGTSAAGAGGVGIHVTGPDGAVIGPYNLISGNTSDGILVDGNSDEVTIVGNLIGTDVTGLIGLGNGQDGIQFDATGKKILDILIGSPVAADRNVISDNTRYGMYLLNEIDGDDGSGSFIEGNTIGLRADGLAALGNGSDGIRIQGVSGESDEITIRDNLISGNVGSGIWLEATKEHFIYSNLIGTNSTGMALGNNEGITLISNLGFDTKRNEIGDLSRANPADQNEIAFNTFDGIRLNRLAGGTKKNKENEIGANSIHDNGGLGIDLENGASGSGPTTPLANANCNNSNDDDWGNRGLGKPTISDADLTLGVLTVSGNACPSVVVDVYAVDDPANLNGQPEVFLGTTTATAAGLWTMTPAVGSVVVGDELTALQTDTEGGRHETSEAADNIVVTTCDLDGDGFNDSAQLSCPTPVDCDDTDATVFPGATELCDGQLNDCDNTIGTGEVDVDLDQYVFCTLDLGGWDGSGTVVGGDDCNDGSPITFPGNTATLVIGDDIDGDCSGSATCFEDLDGDTFGSTVVSATTVAAALGVTTTNACDLSTSFIANDSTDCNDNSPITFPGNTASLVTGDDIDGDCSGTAVCFVDGDNDGAGSAATTTTAASAGVTTGTCDASASGLANDSTDCNDGSSITFPGNTTSLVAGDDIDGDCSSTATCFEDLDGDTFGSTVVSATTVAAALGVTTTNACDLSTSFIANDSTDCNDNSAITFPGNTTSLVTGDDIDGDCSGTATCFQDVDQDGFGSTATTTTPASGGVTTGTCDASASGLANDSTDCNDADNTVFPTATELCDGQLNNCSGTIGATEVDVDLDQYAVCTLDPGGWDGAGTVVGGDDCDDTDNTVYPTAPDLCDGQVNNCGGSIGANEVDADLDQYVVCTLDAGGWDGAGTVVGGDDCDDTDNTVFPTATELCDGQLNDCNGTIGAGEVDGDSDTYVVCSLDTGGWDGAGTVGGGDDCDDSVFATNPGATEICNAVDDDCDGHIDDGFDVDGDGYTTCGADGNGATTADNDCDDAVSTTNPGATEVCNAVDDDCDGTLDDGFDVDGDGYTTCGADGNAATAGDNDCDDAVSATNPGATESCNAVDDDCDGTIDDGFDGDGDGFTTCGADGDASATADNDCDDGVAAVYPGALELCNGVDDDCDGTVDEDLDLDGDGVTNCAGDCDDTDATVYTGAPELCDGLDNDCDTVVPLDEQDPDGDGFFACDVPPDCDDTDATVYPGAPELCDGLDNDCDGVTPVDELDGDDDGQLPCEGDCDDTDATIYLGADEICNDGIDQDCNGEDATDVDDDGDGWSLCDGDCDDIDPEVNPGAEEICDDGLDNDCDGLALDSLDADSDGISSCDGDCDDTDATVFPGNLEICNGVDDDCDDEIDEDALDLDEDGYDECEDCDDTRDDVFPGADELCDGLDGDCDGLVPDDELDVDGDEMLPCGGDCDDTDAGVFLGADEVCGDGIDQDCDESDLPCAGTITLGTPLSDEACGAGASLAGGTGPGTLVLALLAGGLIGVRRRRRVPPRRST